MWAIGQKYSYLGLFQIALLCGPPGLGKSWFRFSLYLFLVYLKWISVLATLAHAIAFHAKYHPVEMNASDDRSVEHFKKQLEASTQMKATLDKDSRPHCLVIDEIDGAPTVSPLSISPTRDLIANLSLIFSLQSTF